MFKKTTILLSLLFLSACSFAEKTEKNKGMSFYVENKKAIIETNEIETHPRIAIKNYLLSQKDFVWQTEEGGQNFCAFYPYNPVNESEIYLWVRCSELKNEEGELKELSGVSGPAKLTLQSDGKFSHQIPRDGSLYSEDLKNIFPKDIRDKMTENEEMTLVNVNSDLLEEAKQYFAVTEFSSIPNSFVQRCQQDSDCITPFNYLIRSSCPYGSKCVEGECKVVCEMY